MLKRTHFAVVAVASVVSGCGLGGSDPMLLDDLNLFTNKVEAVRTMVPQGSAFNQSLKDGYLALATDERSSGDRDGLHFLRKGVASAEGENVLPDPVSLRSIGNVEELTMARARLVSALDETARRKVPLAAGRAQVAYDCWLEADEDGDADGIARCRAEFEQAMQEVEDGLAGPFDNVRIVFFAFDKADLSAVARSQLDDVVEDLNSGTPTKVIVAGHTDTVGSRNYNQGLSERRADSVRGYLVDGGVDSSVIETIGYGETQLRVETADGVNEEGNRRVEISVE